MMSLMDEQGPYLKEDDGRTIKVPEEQVKQWRMEIATLGINFGGTVGYEVFDKRLLDESFVQRVNKQRALEGELVKTIKHLRGVKELVSISLFLNLILSSLIKTTWCFCRH